MKKTIAFFTMALLTSTLFAADGSLTDRNSIMSNGVGEAVISSIVSRGDIDVAFSFAYDKYSETTISVKRRMVGSLYIATLIAEKKCLSGQLSLEFCNSNSMSEAASKIESIDNELAKIFILAGDSEAKRQEKLNQIEALEVQRNELGESLVAAVSESLDKLGLK